MIILKLDCSVFSSDGKHSEARVSFEATGICPGSMFLTCFNRITGLFRTTHGDANGSLKSSTEAFSSMNMWPYGDKRGASPSVFMSLFLLR